MNMGVYIYIYIYIYAKAPPRDLPKPCFLQIMPPYGVFVQKNAAQTLRACRLLPPSGYNAYFLSRSAAFTVRRHFFCTSKTKVSIIAGNGHQICLKKEMNLCSLWAIMLTFHLKVKLSP